MLYILFFFFFFFFFPCCFTIVVFNSVPRDIFWSAECFMIWQVVATLTLLITMRAMPIMFMIILIRIRSHIHIPYKICLLGCLFSVSIITLVLVFIEQNSFRIYTLFKHHSWLFSWDCGLPSCGEVGTVCGRKLVWFQYMGPPSPPPPCRQ